MEYGDFLKLRIKWQREIQKLKNEIENPNKELYKDLDDDQRAMALMFLNKYKEGEITAYKRLINDIDEICGYEMDMLEKSLKEVAL